MANKTYRVRDGFSFRMTDDKGNTKVYGEGDTLRLDEDTGDMQHQLERVSAEKTEKVPAE